MGNASGAETTSDAAKGLLASGPRRRGMAEKLVKYYAYVFEEKGYEGKVLLAALTQIPAVMAAAEPDSEDNLKKFKEAVEQITQKPAPEY